jgi:hypothetical protein
MSLWRVVVETTDSSNATERYNAIVLANTDRGAKVMAGKAVDELVGRERRFISAEAIDPYTTSLISLVEAEQERMKEA